MTNEIKIENMTLERALNIAKNGSSYTAMKPAYYEMKEALRVLALEFEKIQEKPID